MAIEIIGMVGTQDVSESRGSPGGPAIDPGYLTRFAQAHELAGGGRVAIHHISGGDEADQQRDGDFTGHDRRYARTAEFMSVLRRELTAAEPFDHDGEFYRVRGAYSDVKPVTSAGIPLYFGGASAAAAGVGAEHADVYMLWGEPVAQIAQRVAEVRVAASGGAQVQGVLTPGRAAAPARSSSVGSARLQEQAAKHDVHDERLWFGVTRLTGPGGNSSALVGTPGQVAEALLAYRRVGVDTVLIRGFDPLEDVVDWGRELMPLLRAQADIPPGPHDPATPKTPISPKTPATLATPASSGVTAADHG